MRGCARYEDDLRMETAYCRYNMYDMNVKGVYCKCVCGYMYKIWPNELHGDCYLKALMYIGTIAQLFYFYRSAIFILLQATWNTIVE